MYNTQWNMDAYYIQKCVTELQCGMKMFYTRKYILLATIITIIKSLGCALMNIIVLNNLLF